MLNKSGSKIDPCWTLEAIYSQKPEDDPIFSLLAILKVIIKTQNFKTISRHKIIVHKHFAWQLTNHDGYNQKPLVN